MSVTKDDVRKVARLSRIAVPEEKLDTLAGELTGIMGWIEQLNEVDVEGVEPMTYVVAAKLPMRDDVLEDDVLVHDDPGVLALRLAGLGQVRRDGAAPLLGLSARKVLGARVAQARNLVGSTVQGFHDGLKMDK